MNHNLEFENEGPDPNSIEDNYPRTNYGGGYTPHSYDKNFELNEYGLRVWKHKSNKRLFLEQSYRWVDRLTLIDETEDRQIIMDFYASTFDYYAWKPMTKSEFDSVKSAYKEIYN